MSVSQNDHVAEEVRIWPELHLKEWEETYDMVHRWAQIAGKIQLANTVYINHWWNIAFALSATGFTSGVIPYDNKSFELEFDFITHQLFIKLEDGRKEFLVLKSGTIADFYAELKEKLQSLGIAMRIWPVPVEMDDRLPFDQDHRFRTYDPQYANRYFRALLQASRAMKIFRSDFSGKASPVHFFWGSLDLAVTLFSGRPAPEHPGAPNVGRKVMVQSYNAELASFGFWGGKGLGEAAFYAYAYPEPVNFRDFPVRPESAFYNNAFREFILPYSVVTNAPDPDKLVLDFFRSIFFAAEELGDWDRSLYKRTPNQRV